jgi:LysM repeat protein
MAANKPKAPKKFKQARKAAVADAKGAFSNGKTKARLKDRTLKISADDEQVLRDVKKEAKGNYITDDRGNKVNVKPTETAQERFARDRREAKAAIDRKYGAEDKPAKTAAPAKAEEPAKSSPKGKTKAVVKPASKKPAAAKTVTRAARSAANKAKWASMTPAERKAWSSSKTEAPAKPTATKTAKSKTVTTKTKSPAKPSTPKYVQSTRVNAPATSKEVAVRPKTSTAAVSTKGSGAVADKANKFGKTKKFVKGSAALAVGAEAVSLAKGSTGKDAKEIIRLKNKLAALEGKKGTNAASGFKEGVGSQVGQLASLASFGLVGKTRRQRMDELNAKITKTESKNAAKTAAANKGLRYGPNGESLVPGTDAYKKGSKTRPATGASAAGGKGGTTPGAGGSTSTYVVKRGDNLSKIAKNNNLKLSELLATNTKFKTNAKYKGGNMIWAGTTVKIPKK